MSTNSTALPPSSGGVLIKGKRGKLFAHTYLPGGPYPKPVVMICHGIPGNERLFDFAIALREAGFCTLSFHYSGSWGSDGDYAVSNCFEDCASVLDYIRKNENGWFDLNNVMMLGHSMGGLMTAQTSATQELIKACVILVPMDFRLVAEEAMGLRPQKYRTHIENSSLWLNGLSWDSFCRDAETNMEQMDLISYAPGLAEKPVLTVIAEQDPLLPPEDHIYRLNAAIEACGKGKLKTVRFDDDHSYNVHRAEVRKAAVDFLKEQVG